MNIKTIKAWTIKQIFFGSVLLKVALILFSILSFLIVPIPKEYKNEYNGNPNLFAFFVYDGSNYLRISDSGYIDKDAPEKPEKYRYVSFLPGLPLLNYSGRLVKSIINTRYYGPVFINLMFFIVLCFSLKYYLDDEYKEDEGLKRYIALTYLFFPFSFFFHLNYTEVIFMSCVFIIFNLINRDRAAKANILGLFMGFVRVTAIPFGFFAWLKYILRQRAETKAAGKPLLSRYIPLFFNSTTFLFYAIGTLATFVYYQFEFGNFFLYFKSQKEFYGRNRGSNWFSTVVEELQGKAGYYDTPNVEKIEIVPGVNTGGWDSFIQQTGFHFYNNNFRLVYLLWFPFLIAITGTILLIWKKRWFDLMFSWGMWIIPMLSASTASIDRYILQSFPFIFVISEFAYKNTLTRYMLFIGYICLFVLGFLLHSHGFWIG